ncbi:MAG: hypothetical protein NTV93_20935 [Verrucomicrobia bacterium]|nr:hypothetical protein [Verrucomicrobiota bacterium]
MRTLTQPVTARNLTAWFVSVPPGQQIPDYTVLEEAMENLTGLLHETGNVNQLLIENPGDHDLFIQAGDIVKGGRQDRTLGADFIVPAKSGKVPIPVFCVEAARWHKRKNEPDAHFSKSSDYASSKKLRAALRTSKSQGEVWASVKEEQEKLSESLGSDATSAESPSSLQLSYEKQAASLDEYLAGLGSALSTDSVGVVWAINGKLSHADIYGGPVLFRKVWKKLLRAAAFEAIGERSEQPAEALRDIAEVSAWLEEASAAASEDENLPPRTRLSTRRAKAQLRFETRDTSVADPIHLSILAQ